MIKALMPICIFALLTSNVISQNCQQNADHPGYMTLTQTIGSEMVTREYILHVPSSYDPSVSSSLIINMHGFGDCAAGYAETIGDFYEFNVLADLENIILAYPQGAYRPDKEDHYWEPGDDGQEHLYENDVYFIEQLVAEIRREYNVNHHRIYAAGYSNGGMMAYSLACNNTELFAGIGIMSGVMLEEECNKNYSIPIIVFHGIADEVLPYDGGVWYPSTQEVVNYWLDKNNIPVSSLLSTELKNGDVIKAEYSGGNDNTCLSFYTINEEWDKPGDHVWFSEPIEGPTPNEIMWEFFKNYCGKIISTEETLQDSDISIYPNPFSDKVTIRLDNIANQFYDIYNSQGIRIKTGTINQTQNLIDLSDLPPNVYLVKIDGNILKLTKTE